MARTRHVMLVFEDEEVITPEVDILLAEPIDMPAQEDVAPADGSADSDTTAQGEQSGDATAQPDIPAIAEPTEQVEPEQSAVQDTGA